MNFLLSQKSFICLFFLLMLTSGIHFCFMRTIESNTPASRSTETQQAKVSAQSHSQSELRSYHPQYLLSLSYPTPLTPHIYYGEVINNNPAFLYSDVDKWDPKNSQKFTINGIEYTDASAKYFLLRREQLFRYMFVIQMENAYQHQESYKMNVYTRSDHFLVVCEYRQERKIFALYLSQKEGKLMTLTQHPGITLHVRNQSTNNAKTNWKFSRQVRWIGQDKHAQGTQYTGFVLQIEYTDRKLLNEVKLNFRQLYSEPGSSLQSFLTSEPSLFMNERPQSLLIKQKYNTCAETAMQKIFDGLSYEYGRLQIRDGSKIIQNDPQGLLSFCPSGKRFPWGFLWDDGFHCEVAVRREHKLVIKVIKSWLDTQLDNGWIPREQNRGAERQQLCSCPRFMPKDIKDGNPPTLLLALDYLNKNHLLSNSVFEIEYWDKIKNWYHWFLQTQKDGDALIFKWHDSLQQQGASFTSGMDDFPRPAVSKGQVDLQSWMYFFTKFMAEASHLYDEPNQEYITNLELIKSNFKYFIDPQDQSYRDIAADGSFSEHFGYPNILPIAFGVPQYRSSEYNATLNRVKNELDIGKGLTSISTKSHFYLQNKDAYWRGPVWININYLFLRGLKLYYPEEKTYYEKLRKELLAIVCGNWQQTGYFYENYINGKGSFGYPFNGWTSLVAIIENQNY